MSYAPKIQSADALSRKAGVKLLIYGPPGTAKTPICQTAPRPFLLSIENGTRSLRGLNVPAYHERDVPRLLEFFRWFESSREARAYDTLCVDSMSEMADLVLAREAGATTNKQRAYGEMGDRLKIITRQLLSWPCNVYMIAKLDQKHVASHGKRWPLFPGNEISAFIPHEVDEIYYADRQVIPGTTAPVLCWQTYSDPTTLARSRSGADPFEEPNLGKLFAKLEK